MPNRQAPTDDTPKVRTLLAHVPRHSLGLRTTLLGRMVFLCVSTSISVTLLRYFPSTFLPHLLLLLASCSAICLAGAAHLLIGRPVIMLSVTCCFLGAINYLFTPAFVGHETNVRICFALARATAFGSLSLSTLLVGAITRPSDISRLANRFTQNVYTLMLLAVPFATFDFLATTFQDILTAASARSRKLAYARRVHARIVDAGSALLATALTRSLYLYQTSYSLDAPRAMTRRCFLLDRYPLFRPGDLVLLLILAPGSIALLSKWLR